MGEECSAPGTARDYRQPREERKEEMNALEYAVAHIARQLAEKINSEGVEAIDAEYQGITYRWLMAIEKKPTHEQGEAMEPITRARRALEAVNPHGQESSSQG
jgi:hypothetical protein